MFKTYSFITGNNIETHATGAPYISQSIIEYGEMSSTNEQENTTDTVNDSTTNTTTTTVNVVDTSTDNIIDNTIETNTNTSTNTIVNNVVDTSTNVDIDISDDTSDDDSGSGISNYILLFALFSVLLIFMNKDLDLSQINNIVRKYYLYIIIAALVFYYSML